MFQTKVKQDYIQYVQNTDFQTQWLEQTLQELGKSNGEFESVKYSGNLFAINAAVVQVFSILRTDILEPIQYDRLFMQIKDFIQKLYEFYKACCSDSSPVQGKHDPIRLYNEMSLVSKVVPRVYMISIIGRILCERVQEKISIIQRSKKLTKSQKQEIVMLQKSQDDIITDISSQAHGIQNPIILIFFRNYLIQTFTSSPNVIFENLTEMNRFYARTQFDPARTAAEARRRDDRRTFLGKTIADGFSNFLINSQNCAEILPKVLQEITQSTDNLAQVQILNAAISQMPVSLILQNLQILLDQITTNIIGTGAFLQCIEKIYQNIEQNNYEIICTAGMKLAKLIVNQYYIDEHELTKLLALGGGVKSNLSPWISILSYLMQIGTRIWPDDLSKISFAFDLILQVLYPEMDDFVNEIALGIDENAICFIEEEKLQSQKERKMNLNDFGKRKMSGKDEISIIQLMVGPLSYLDASLIVPYCMLAPMVVLRESVEKERKIEFCVELAKQIIILNLTDEDFLVQQEAHENQGRNVVQICSILTTSHSFIFAQLLHKIHGSKQVYQLLINSEIILSETASTDITPALFFTLLRDNYASEALFSLNYLPSQNVQQIVFLNLQAARLSADTFNFIRNAFEAFEICAISSQQNTLISLFVNKLMEIDLGGEAQCIVSRLVAAACNLLQREQRCVALSKVVVLCRKIDIESAELIDKCKEMSLKWGSFVEIEQMKVILGEIEVERVVFEGGQDDQTQILENSEGNNQIEEKTKVGEEVQVENQHVEEEIYEIEEVIEEIEEIEQ
ncbi:Vacuolar protein sorting 35 [Spironucleus salmonicida]|uniref:Vacuolar protein sorting 35 n=1 Tax=Spironucleus salmonicida TaxID=348837 RepID=V6LYG7_9EUKA|nr:Vacuolar protein sorting 35 [Spironucleus salmonicida]|eukprot:EST49293.1 Vacuolar protein sorting 35 [Spironucleus salmonicida]